MGASNSVYDVAKKRNEIRAFMSYVDQYPTIKNMLKNDNQITLLAPQGEIPSLNGLNANQMMNIISLHILRGQFNACSANINIPYNDGIQKSMTLEKNRIIIGNFVADNGLVHIIDKPLFTVDKNGKYIPN